MKSSYIIFIYWGATFNPCKSVVKSVLSKSKISAFFVVSLIAIIWLSAFVNSQYTLIPHANIPKMRHKISGFIIDSVEDLNSSWLSFLLVGVNGNPEAHLINKVVFQALPKGRKELFYDVIHVITLVFFYSEYSCRIF